LIFFLFGLIFIGRILHPDFPPNHIIHWAGEKKYQLEGVLYRPSEPMPDKTRLYLRAEKIYLGEGIIPVAGNLLLTVKDRKIDCRYGDRVRFLSKLYLPRPATNPGAFDYRRFLALQEIWVTALANSADEVVRMAEGQGNPFFHFIERKREKIRVFLNENAPPESRGIIKALVLGERGDIDPAVNEKFIITGVNHILSISGMHVALVAAFFLGAVRFLLRFFPTLLLRLDLNKTAALAAMVPVIFYTFIAGLQVAAVRSTVMTLSFLLALLLDREKDLYDALFLAAFLILIAHPAALFDLSCQLSFFSVLAIFYLTPRLAEFFGPLKTWTEEQGRIRKKIWFYLGASLLASVAAILGTGPLVAFYFNRISLVGFLANLLLVPLMGLGNTLLSLLAAFLIFVFPPLAKLTMALNVFILDVSLALVNFFSRFPLAAKRVSTPTLVEILLLYGILILAANGKRWKRAFFGAAALAGIYFAIQVSGFYALRHGQELSVTFLDVGQGDAAVVCFPRGQVMVIDGGGSPDGSFDTGERIVAPYLWTAKRKEIDYLVNTHFHPDHLQGLFFLLENFKIDEVWDNGETGEGLWEAKKFMATAGDRLQPMGLGEPPRDIGGVRLEFLHPPRRGGEASSWEGNNASLVIKLTYGDVSFLFCGDVEAAVEGDLLEKKMNLKSTVLKVPHHGSKTSSTLKFVETVSPKFAIFTVKAGGIYRLPHPAVWERYTSLGVKALRTDREGAITFRTDGKNLELQTFLTK